MIREPVVSGRFYPASAKELQYIMEECENHDLGAAGVKIQVSGKLLGLILPHAGYIFSGPVATWGIKRLAAENPLPTRFLLLGPKHTPYGAKASISAATEWKTPLGSVPVDDNLRDALKTIGSFECENMAHTHEHSIEVQLPFLQRLFKENRFSIVPVALHYSSYNDCLFWGEAIGKILSKPEFSDVRFIVSSDFSHDAVRSDAYRLDAQAIDYIEQLDSKGFYELVVSEDRSICGFIPITVALVSLKKRKATASRLTYATSMDIMDHPRGVGYAAISFEEESAPA